ncbi:aromatic ring-hydroxylating dioxygenase subunit alpha [Novosphingobium sediminicola]|uniref:Vanillate O-demethylase monooxygenase subunit n=1 Tax=Novosphingobium sediminicola TaxID=563162 RepID=A0A7W6CBQ1_9SPHN|nr:aromatic ring-hydroxylating dioxygenase subunit alpha [Novosphingobium sediminicola]MBB3953641.1 vanillate O-demethylase monooxygenase subunit [Novosphingobium sediminicola]
MPFIRNAWYVAAWDSEVTAEAILSRHILDEKLIFFRQPDGTVTALSGVCPHRYASLSMGRLEDGAVHCGYHGLGFDRTGACVHNPFGAPPKGMRLRSYPVVERFSAIWIWMGEPDAADPALLPDFSFNDPADYCVGQGYLLVQANWELEVENILDLSHIQFLHPTTLGSSEVANGAYEWHQDGEQIWSNRDVYGEMMRPELAGPMGVPSDRPVDRWIHTRWDAPANLAIFAGAVPAGQDRGGAPGTPTGHLFTPATQGSTHYFYSIAFPRSMGPQAEILARTQVDFLKMPFETEDLPMLEEQQRNLAGRSLRDVKLGWLPGDAAGARARNILYARIDAEAATAPSS